MADMANPKRIIDYYGTRKGVSMPGSAGVRPIGPTPARAFPLAPYQAPPVNAAPAPAAYRGKVIPSGPTIEMGGRSPVPAVRPPAGAPAAAPRSAVTLEPVAPSAPKQIGYRPAASTARVPGPGVEGMGDFAANQGAEVSRLSRGKLTGFRGVLNKGAGILKQGVKSLFSPVGLTIQGLSAVAGAQSDATAYDNLTFGVGTSAPGRFTPGEGQAFSTNAISYKDPYKPGFRQALGMTPRTGMPTIAKDQRPSPTGGASAASQLAPFAVAAPVPATRRSAPAPAPAAQTARGGSFRRAAPAVEPALRGNPADPPAGFGETQRAAGPRIVELTDAAGAMPTALANDLPVDQDGGYAFTGDRGGNVERMFYLRPRTAAEEVAAPPIYNQGEYAAAEKDTSPGSQGAWELEQERDAMINRPFPFKTEAAMLARRTQAETRANNLRTYLVNQQNADTSAAGTVSQNLERETLLPGKVLAQDSALETDAMGREKTAEEIKGMPLDREMKSTMSGYYLTLGANVEKKSNDDLALQKLLMQDQWKKDELEARNNSPLTKADAEMAAGLAEQAGLLPSEAATAVKAGYRKVQKGKNRWLRADIPQGLVNDAGQVYTPGAEAAPVRTGTRPNGEVWGEFADGSVRRIN
jgi:hypothetical protein